MTILGNVKDVTVRTLVSGDKQARVVIDIVGQTEIDKIQHLIALPVQCQVAISTLDAPTI